MYIYIYRYRYIEYKDAQVPHERLNQVLLKIFIKIIKFSILNLLFFHLLLWNIIIIFFKYTYFVNGFCIHV